jgi:TRAP-type C4-dicarboxylate transport system substrate-binding protein
MSVRSISVSLVALATGALTAVPAGADEIVLKSGTALIRTQSLTHTFLQISEEISKEAKGRLRINYLGGPEVTPPGKAGDALKRGVLDLLHGPASYYNGVIPETDALLVAERSAEELRANGGWALIEKLWAEKLNARILGWYEIGFQAAKDAPQLDLYNLYVTRKPAMDPATGISLKGFKMRTTATYRALLNALGATPVAMKASEIYTGLQRGVVQGFGFPGVSISALGLTGVVKYRIDPGFYKGNNLVLANLDKWKALPKDLRDLIEKRFHEGELRSRIYVAADARKEEAALVKGGMQIVTLEGKGAEAYRKLAYDLIWRRLEKRAPANAKALAAKFRK